MIYSSVDITDQDSFTWMSFQNFNRLDYPKMFVFFSLAFSFFQKKKTFVATLLRKKNNYFKWCISKGCDKITLAQLSERGPGFVSRWFLKEEIAERKNPQKQVFCIWMEGDLTERCCAIRATNLRVSCLICGLSFLGENWAPLTLGESGLMRKTLEN